MTFASRVHREARRIQPDAGFSGLKTWLAKQRIVGDP